MSKACDSYQHGWALPTTLFALVMALSIMRLLSLESIDTSVIGSDLRHGEALHTIIATAARDYRATSTRCEKIATSPDGRELSLEICRESARPFTTSPPSVSLPSLLVDYDLIFSNAIACPTEPRATSSAADPSPFASTDCHLSGDSRGSTTLLSNIMGASLSLTHPGADPLVLATPGRIVISNEVQSSRDLLVVAGGDVRIATLGAASSSTITVTIISSLGRITVERVGDGVSLVAAGRKELVVPLTSPSLSYPLPPFRAPSLYSFKTTH